LRPDRAVTALYDGPAGLKAELLNQLISRFGLKGHPLGMAGRRKKPPAVESLAVFGFSAKRLCRSVNPVL
jgi:hypothetical protein